MHRSVIFSLQRHFDLKCVACFSSSSSQARLRILRQCRQLIPDAVSRSTSKCLFLPSSIIPGSSSCSKLFHTSLQDRAEGDDSKKVVKRKSRQQKEPQSSKDEELRSAAQDAARSLPGDWNRTADELMARLSMTAESPAEGVAEEGTPPETSGKSSLLSTMKVGRSFEKKSGKSSGWQRDSSVDDKMMMRKRLARRSETFTSLYSQPRLGIFDAEKVKKQAATKDSSEGKESLWQVVYKEKLKRSGGGLPRNGFEEMVQWTSQGRMWSFPIDNEEDMHEERHYKFHEHVFLNHHLADFPKEGPLRRFMDLVVTGLSQNPWISVPEKVEHIRWYADYFRQKQKLLESSMGERARMNEKQTL